MRIIVNADDLGRSEAVNEATFALMQRGLVTSATIIATGSALSDVAKRYKDFPHCSFGVHLFLDEFKPVTDLSEFHEILDSDGRLKEDARTFTFHKALRKALLKEWEAQVERVRSVGIPVSHLDSHHHVHTLPAMFGTFKALQRRTGLRKVRVSLNCYLQSVSPLHLAKKQLFNFALRHYVPSITTRHFVNFGIFHALLSHNKLPKTSSIEVMVHPGAETYMKTSVESEDELVKLDGSWQELLPREHRFISYNDL